MRHPIELERAGHIADLELFCGVPFAAKVSARTFLNLPETALPPLAHVTLTYAGDMDLFEALLASDRLRAVRTLTLPARLDGLPVNHLTGNHIEALSKTDGLDRLSTLDVSGHGFDPMITNWMLTPEAIARFPRLASVRGLPFEPEAYWPELPWRKPRGQHPWALAAISTFGGHRGKR
jgi:hypothetical protein